MFMQSLPEFENSNISEKLDQVLNDLKKDDLLDCKFQNQLANSDNNLMIYQIKGDE